MVSNPYHPPEPGSDDPHQGVDLAVIDPANRIALSGSPVQAILNGQVAMLINDRFPYGNAVLIETPLEAAGPDWWAQAGVPTPAPTLAPRSALTCPAFVHPPAGDAARRSVYVLYAHLQSIAQLSVGQPVSCGQALGVVGMSGNALAPHLHVEIRAAPAAIQLGSMEHYDVSASQDEMAAYCLWRVSGLFQLVDPLNFMWPGSSKK
jgi:murein DD-endopeptidase MepM/ murein hydrolase activator NlpD